MQTIENPPIPFYYPLGYGGLPYDAELIVHGSTYHGHDKSFAIELRAGSAGQDIALHVNFRFGHFSEHTVVMNTCSGGHWGKEGRHHNPVHIGDVVRVKIALHEKHYLIEVNEKHLCHFHHRIPPQSVTGLDIKGNITVSRLHMMNFGMAAPAPQFQPPSAPYPNTYPAMAPPIYNSYEYSSPVPAPQYPTMTYGSPQPQVVYVGGHNRSCSCDGDHRCHQHRHHHHHGHLFGHHHHHHHC